MSITREQVADLQPGDVVEYRYEGWPAGTVVSGPVRRTEGGQLIVADRLLIDSDGSVTASRYGADLTIVSRAPRPLYVNHPRTEPVPGDVVRDADSSDDPKVWFVLDNSGIQGAPWASWGAPDYDVGITWDWFSREDVPTRLRLLVDGETGQVVP